MIAMLIRIALLLLAIWLFRRMLSQRQTSAPRSTDIPEDPYQVLGVSPHASPETIRSAYKRALQKYHPDKVADMGDDLQKLAQKKTREIIEAYRALQSPPR